MERRSSNRLLRPSRLVSHAGTPGRIRTCDLRIRSPLLYPLSYRRLTFLLLAGPLVPSPLFARCSPISVWGGWSGREDLNLRPPAPKAGALARLRHAPYVRIHTTFLLSLHDYHKSRKDSSNRLFPLCFQWRRISFHRLFPGGLQMRCECAFRSAQWQAGHRGGSISSVPGQSLSGPCGTSSSHRRGG